MLKYNSSLFILSFSNKSEDSIFVTSSGTGSYLCLYFSCSLKFSLKLSYFYATSSILARNIFKNYDGSSFFAKCKFESVKVLC